MERTNEQRMKALQAFSDKLLRIKFLKDESISLDNTDGLSCSVSNNHRYCFKADFEVSILPINKDQSISYFFDFNESKKLESIAYYHGGKFIESEVIIGGLAEKSLLASPEFSPNEVKILDSLIDIFAPKFIPEKIKEIFGEEYEKSVRGKINKFTSAFIC